MSAGRMSRSDAALFASLEGGTVVSVGTAETAEAWMGRVPWLEIRRADGSVVVVEAWRDDEGNGPGALWFNTAPTLDHSEPCRECGTKDNPAGGDGWDGLCSACADRADAGQP